MFVFNFGIGSLEQSVSWVGSLSKHHFFQTDNQKAVLFTLVFSLFELYFSRGGERIVSLRCCDSRRRHGLSWWSRRAWWLVSNSLRLIPVTKTRLILLAGKFHHAPV